MVIRRIGVGSAATVFGGLYALMGLVFGALIALFSFVGAGFMAAAPSDPEVPAFFGAIFGVGAIIILPIFYGIMGVVTGALGAAFYNLIAGTLGGLRLETQ